MNKPFITYTAQVEKLTNEKHLIVTNTNFAITSLKNISYFGLIGGYKHPFIDVQTHKYMNNTSFEDIVALYEFDEELRGKLGKSGRKRVLEWYDFQVMWPLVSDLYKKILR